MEKSKSTDIGKKEKLTAAKRHDNMYYINKWGVTEKQLEEAMEQTDSEDEGELYTYLSKHGYISK